MARQANNGRRVAPGRNPSTGAAVLDRPAHDAPRRKRRICCRRRYSGW